MPFTLSHTVAVIPLAKYSSKYGSISPLIIGSMVPDVAYLTPILVDQRVDSHSLLGIYLFCIPMGLTLYFLYHILMAPVLVSILPKWYSTSFRCGFVCRSFTEYTQPCSYFVINYRCTYTRSMGFCHSPNRTTADNTLDGFTTN